MRHVTKCQVCEEEWEHPIAFAVHLARSGHGAAHREALTAGGGLYYCLYGGCQESFRTRTARRIHQTLVGHQRRKDTATNGDEVRRPPAHPRLRPPTV